MKKKSIILGFSILALSMFSGFSQDTAPAENPSRVEATEPAADSVEADNTQASAKKEKKKSKKKKEEDIYSGWAKERGLSIDETYGTVRLRAKTKKGTFNIALLEEKNYKTIPVLATSDEYTTSGFFLKAGDKVINLINDSRVKYTGWKTDNGMVLGYRLDNVADVMVYFDCFQSNVESDIDSVKIRIAVTNMGKKKVNFAVKAIFDTVLGETDRHHFYTSSDSAVKNELSLRSLENDPWFISKNVSAQLQMIFNMADTTQPEILAFANYSTLNTRSWEPDLLTYRTFDTVLSYNNSACGVIWPEHPLSVKQQYSEIMYLSLSSGDRKPSGADYLATHQDGVIDNAVLLAEKNNAENAEEGKSPDQVSSENADSSQNDEKGAGKNVPYVKFDVNSLTQEQLSPEYIRKLLSRIETLEEDDVSLNKEELQQLNAELDAILAALRK